MKGLKLRMLQGSAVALALLMVTFGPVQAAGLLMISPSSSQPGYPTAPQAGIDFHDATNIYQAPAAYGAVNVGVYNPGVTPWMDLLVQMNGQWYGPNRDPSYNLTPQPLPPEYPWQVTQGFGALPNGEAWWTGPETSATATLYGPNGAVVTSVPFQLQLEQPYAQPSRSTTPRRTTTDDDDENDDDDDDDQQTIIIVDEDSGEQCDHDWFLQHQRWLDREGNAFWQDKNGNLIVSPDNGSDLTKFQFLRRTGEGRWQGKNGNAFWIDKAGSLTADPKNTTDNAQANTMPVLRTHRGRGADSTVTTDLTLLQNNERQGSRQHPDH